MKATKKKRRRPRAGRKHAAQRQTRYVPPQLIKKERSWLRRLAEWLVR